jgi:hypothetical protein
MRIAGHRAEIWNGDLRNTKQVSNIAFGESSDTGFDFVSTRGSTKVKGNLLSMRSDDGSIGKYVGYKQYELAHLGGCVQKLSDWVDNEIIIIIIIIIINTRREATQRVMEAELTTLTHKIAIQLHLVSAVPFAVLAPGGQSGNFWTYPRTL